MLFSELIDVLHTRAFTGENENRLAKGRLKMYEICNEVRN